MHVCDKHIKRVELEGIFSYVLQIQYWKILFHSENIFHFVLLFSFL